MKNGITIFTPTYNRAYVLDRLYNSLLKQADKRFEWVVVDDGSTDNTKELVGSWVAEKKVPIRYYYQENAGKMQAHNKGTELAEYEFFCCVDSDDCLTDNAIGKVLTCWEKKKNDKKIIGLLNFKLTAQGRAVSSGNLKNVIGRTCTLWDAYRKYGLTGDTMLIYRTEVIRQHHFPKFTGEKFVPESYLYDQLDQDGKLYVQGEKLYVCEYLPDGYTASIRKTNHDNPRGYEVYILQRLKLDKTFKDRILDTIRYIAIELVLKADKKDILSRTPYKTLTNVMMPAGKRFYDKVYKQFD